MTQSAQSAQSAPVQPAPAQHAPAQHVPAQSAPVQPAPAQHAPARPAPGPAVPEQGGRAPLPGSAGEHRLQRERGTTDRARAFYDRQVLDHLNASMREFVGRQTMVFVATADAHGECDSSFRAGPPGFVHVLDERRLAYPEYRGNGVLASLGNIAENPHIGLVLIDFFRDLVGLHVNGRAAVVDTAVLLAGEVPAALREAAAVTAGRRPECWVLVEVEEAYIHCSKHIPLLEPRDRRIHWGTDDVRRKGGDFFDAGRSPRPWGPDQGQTERRVIDLRDAPPA